MKMRWMMILTTLITSTGCVASSDPEPVDSTEEAPASGDGLNLVNTSPNNDAPDLCVTGIWQSVQGVEVNFPVLCNEEPYIDRGDPPPDTIEAKQNEIVQPAE